MKGFAKHLLAAGVLTLGATGLVAADNDSFEQWYKAKHGRTSPSEERRLQEERKNSASRAQETSPVAPAKTNWIEEHLKGKYGRNTPAEEARIDAERDNSASRQAQPPTSGPQRTPFEEAYRHKYGRYPGR